MHKIKVVCISVAYNRERFIMIDLSTVSCCLMLKKMIPMLRGAEKAVDSRY